MPKSATTWVYRQLVLNPAVDYSGVKEPDFDVLYDFDSYKDYNNQFEFSLNMNVELWSIDSDLLSTLSTYATHSSIIFRNPYEFVNSAVNYFKPNCSNDDYINFVIESSYLEYVGNVKRLKTYFPNMQVLVQDQITNDPQGTMDRLTDYLGICSAPVDTTKANVTKYTDDVLFTKDNILTINKSIDEFVDYSGIDVEYWKR